MTDPVKRQKTGDTGLPTVRVGFRNPEMEKNGTIRSPFGDYAGGGFFLVWKMIKLIKRMYKNKRLMNNKPLQFCYKSLLTFGVEKRIL